jgi:hypothetical protein
MREPGSAGDPRRAQAERPRALGTSVSAAQPRTSPPVTQRARDGNAANGAETDTRTSACHCGACGRACESLPGVGVGRCVGCACQIDACDEGRADCDRSPDNGCEAALATDARHCGMCGRACAEGEACVAGACGFVERYTLCADRQANLSNDREHCGSCDTRCAAGEVCEGGRCAASCTPGRVTCGTETCVALDTSSLHCGACGSVCPMGVRCGSGRCAATCVAGTTVCQGSCVDLRTDASNCGRCGRVCPAGAFCREGACHVRMCPGARP